MGNCSEGGVVGGRRSEDRRHGGLIAHSLLEKRNSEVGDQSKASCRLIVCVRRITYHKQRTIFHVVYRTPFTIYDLNDLYDFNDFNGFKDFNDCNDSIRVSSRSFPRVDIFLRKAILISLNT